MLAYHHGQSLYDGPVDDTITAPDDVRPDRRTIQTITLRGCTLTTVTIRGCTIRGVPISNMAVKTVTVNRLGNPILGG
jgi:hypothetical protein